MAQCQYGPQGVDFDVVDTEAFEGWQFQSPVTQRTCVCQSQMSDAVVGCMACMNAHKVPSLVGGGGDAWQSYWQTTTQHYCEVDFTPTQGFMEYFQNVQYETFGEDDPDDITSTSSDIQDPPGLSTDASVYYTMSVTRNDVYDIAVPTPDSAGKITYTTTRISDGQIVPTAQAEKEVREQDLGEASISSISTSTSSTRSLGIATPSTSQSSSDDEWDSEQDLHVCIPSKANGYLDFNAPCNQATAILLQCAYGPAALRILNYSFDNDEYPELNPDLPKLSPETERTCICQSQLSDVTIGCLRCVEAHQLTPIPNGTEAYYSAAMQRYCDADYTTKQSFYDFVAEAASEFPYGDDAPAETYTAEVVSTSTDVSLYYTLSVTRSDVWDVALPTPAISDGNIIYTSTRISEGQIVPTARTVKDPDSPMTDSGAAAMHVGAACMLAMAALAALGL
jgi:hypothetical protein